MYARGYQTGLNADGGDIRNQGSVQFLYLTPSDYGPNFKVFGSKFLANWRVNLLWRMQNTGSFWYTPANSGRERRLRPIRTWTDLAVEKRFPFGLGRGDISLFPGGAKPVQPAGRQFLQYHRLDQLGPANGTPGQLSLPPVTGIGMTGAFITIPGAWKWV